MDLKAKNVKFSPKILKEIIEGYTRESGVRGLDRQIAGAMRGIAKRVAMEEKYDISLNSEMVKELLGPTKFSKDMYQEAHVAGVTVGLAWTQVGGDILFIESSLSKGTGKVTLTGNLGDGDERISDNCFDLFEIECGEI